MKEYTGRPEFLGQLQNILMLLKFGSARPGDEFITLLGLTILFNLKGFLGSYLIITYTLVSSLFCQRYLAWPNSKNIWTGFFWHDFIVSLLEVTSIWHQCNKYSRNIWLQFFMPLSNRAYIHTHMYVRPAKVSVTFNIQINNKYSWTHI